MPASAIDLCTVAQVRAYMQHDATVGTDNDDLTQELITRASASIMDYTGREFATTASGSTSRSFLYYNGPDRVLNLTPYDARTVTQVELDADVDDSTILTDSAEWRLLPIPSKYGAYHALYLPNHSGTATGRVVTVTGTWGWPTIPSDIAQACIDTVVHWLKTQLPGGTQIEDDRDRYGPVQFPTAARAVMRRYRMVRV